MGNLNKFSHLFVKVGRIVVEVESKPFFYLIIFHLLFCVYQTLN